MSQNVVNYDFQGVVDLFIHEISGDWSQIMSKLDFSSEISTTSADFDRKHLTFLQSKTGHRLLHGL